MKLPLHNEIEIYFIPNWKVRNEKTLQSLLSMNLPFNNFRVDEKNMKETMPKAGKP